MSCHTGPRSSLVIQKSLILPSSRLKNKHTKPVAFTGYFKKYVFNNKFNMYFFYFCHGVRLSPLGTSATVWPVVPAPDYRWRWLWSNRWNANWQGKPKYSEKTCPNVTFSTINPTWCDLESNPDRRSGKPATNRLSYGTATIQLVKFEPRGQ
jgi:hypothetical protein